MFSERTTHQKTNKTCFPIRVFHCKYIQISIASVDNCGMKFTKLSLLACFICLLFIASSCQAFPAGDPEAAIENMRQIPQWHCLRYRKFDLVRRCRNYRIGRKH